MERGAAVSWLPRHGTAPCPSPHGTRSSPVGRTSDCSPVVSHDGYRHRPLDDFEVGSCEPPLGSQAEWHVSGTMLFVHATSQYHRKT